MLALLLLTACASPAVLPDGALPATRAAIDAFALEGRFALRQGDKNYSGRLSWRHGDGQDEVLLSSPFGQGLAQITANAAGAQLTTSDGKHYAAANGELLTRQVLGYPLPLAQLADWLRGRGAGDFVYDAQRRPLQLSDSGWRIDYEYDSDAAQALPARLFAQRTDGVELRLRIDEWTAQPQPLGVTLPLPAAAPESESPFATDPS